MQFWNKRIMGGGSAFDVQRAQTPAAALPASTVTPALDTHRAELSGQHVRALNAQFARCGEYLVLSEYSLTSKLLLIRDCG